MAADLAGQHALVTGAGRGIGRAIALALAAHGAQVTALARSAEQLDEVVRSAAGGSGFGAAAVDVTDDAALESAVEAATRARGPVDVLVNGAGYAPPRTAVVKTAVAEWDRILDTCLRAPMVLSRLVLPEMLTRRRGCIINVVSIAARRPTAREAGYAAAKAGLLAFTRALFAEVRDADVKIAAILPGLTDTAFVPANKRVDRAAFLRPEEVAAAVLQIVRSPASVCPVELVLEPQRDPLRTRAGGR